MTAPNPGAQLSSHDILNTGAGGFGNPITSASQSNE